MGFSDRDRLELTIRTVSLERDALVREVERLQQQCQSHAAYLDAASEYMFSRKQSGPISPVGVLREMRAELEAAREEANRRTREVELTYQVQMKLNREADTLRRVGEEMHKKLQGAYDFYMGGHACGDFTCNCEDPAHCGICDMRQSTAAALTAWSQLESK